jgi:hypothetical protein
MRSARKISLILRVNVFSVERKKLRASCCVIVLPPMDFSPVVSSDQTARVTPW